MKIKIFKKRTNRNVHKRDLSRMLMLALLFGGGLTNFAYATPKSPSELVAYMPKRLTAAPLVASFAVGVSSFVIEQQPYFRLLGANIPVLTTLGLCLVTASTSLEILANKQDSTSKEHFLAIIPSLVVFILSSYIESQVFALQVIITIMCALGIAILHHLRQEEMSKPNFVKLLIASTSLMLMFINAYIELDYGVFIILSSNLLYPAMNFFIMRGYVESLSRMMTVQPEKSRGRAVVSAPVAQTPAPAVAAPTPAAPAPAAPTPAPAVAPTPAPAPAAPTPAPAVAAPTPAPAPAAPAVVASAVVELGDQPDHIQNFGACSLAQTVTGTMTLAGQTIQVSKASAKLIHDSYPAILSVPVEVQKAVLALSSISAGLDNESVNKTSRVIKNMMLAYAANQELLSKASLHLSALNLLTSIYAYTLPILTKEEFGQLNQEAKNVIHLAYRLTIEKRTLQLNGLHATLKKDGSIDYHNSDLAHRAFIDQWAADIKSMNSAIEDITSETSASSLSETSASSLFQAAMHFESTQISSQEKEAVYNALIPLFKEIEESACQGLDANLGDEDDEQIEALVASLSEAFPDPGLFAKPPSSDLSRVRAFWELVEKLPVSDIIALRELAIDPNVQPTLMRLEQLEHLIHTLSSSKSASKRLPAEYLTYLRMFEDLLGGFVVSALRFASTKPLFAQISVIGAFHPDRLSQAESMLHSGQTGILGMAPANYTYILLALGSVGDISLANLPAILGSSLISLFNFVFSLQAASKANENYSSTARDPTYKIPMSTIENLAETLFFVYLTVYHDTIFQERDCDSLLVIACIMVSIFKQIHRVASHNKISMTKLLKIERLTENRYIQRLKEHRYIQRLTEGEYLETIATEATNKLHLFYVLGGVHLFYGLYACCMAACFKAADRSDNSQTLIKLVTLYAGLPVSIASILIFHKRIRGLQTYISIAIILSTIYLSGWGYESSSTGIQGRLWLGIFYLFASSAITFGTNSLRAEPNALGAGSLAFGLAVMYFFAGSVPIRNNLNGLFLAFYYGLGSSKFKLGDSIAKLTTSATTQTKLAVARDLGAFFASKPILFIMTSQTDVLQDTQWFVLWIVATLCSCGDWTASPGSVERAKPIESILATVLCIMLSFAFEKPALEYVDINLTPMYKIDFQSLWIFGPMAIKIACSAFTRFRILKDYSKNASAQIASDSLIDFMQARIKCLLHTGVANKAAWFGPFATALTEAVSYSGTLSNLQHAIGAQATDRFRREAIGANTRANFEDGQLEGIAGLRRVQENSYFADHVITASKDATTAVGKIHMHHIERIAGHLFLKLVLNYFYASFAVNNPQGLTFYNSLFMAGLASSTITLAGVALFDQEFGLSLFKALVPESGEGVAPGAGAIIQGMQNTHYSETSGLGKLALPAGITSIDALTDLSNSTPGLLGAMLFNNYMVHFYFAAFLLYGTFSCSASKFFDKNWAISLPVFLASVAIADLYMNTGRLFLQARAKQYLDDSGFLGSSSFDTSSVVSIGNREEKLEGIRELSLSGPGKQELLDNAKLEDIILTANRESVRLQKNIDDAIKSLQEVSLNKATDCLKNIDAQRQKIVKGTDRITLLSPLLKGTLFEQIEKVLEFTELLESKEERVALEKDLNTQWQGIPDDQKNAFEGGGTITKGSELDTFKKNLEEKQRKILETCLGRISAGLKKVQSAESAASIGQVLGQLTPGYTRILEGLKKVKLSRSALKKVKLSESAASIGQVLGQLAPGWKIKAYSYIVPSDQATDASDAFILDALMFSFLAISALTPLFITLDKPAMGTNQADPVYWPAMIITCAAMNRLFRMVSSNLDLDNKQRFAISAAAPIALFGFLTYVIFSRSIASTTMHIERSKNVLDKGPTDLINWLTTK